MRQYQDQSRSSGEELEHERKEIESPQPGDENDTKMEAVTTENTEQSDGDAKVDEAPVNDNESDKNEDPNSSMDILNDIEDSNVPLLERMQKVRGLITKEKNELNATTLKDYTRLEQFELVTKSSQTVCKHFEEHMVMWNEELSKLRKEMTSINNVMEKKLTHEGVYNWRDQLETDPSDPDAVAREKELIAKTTEANAALAEASKNFSRFEELAAKLEGAAAEAALEAKASQEEARKARENMQSVNNLQGETQEEDDGDDYETRKAEDEEKRRKEEEAEAVRQEMLRKQKEEEERKKRKAEEEHERQRKLELEEAQRKEKETEAKRREDMDTTNPKNWPKWVYSVEPGESGIPLGCIIKAKPNTVARDEVTVECISQLSGVLPLVQNEELVSNVIRISHTDPDFKCLEPLAISLPHCAPRNTSRDTVVKMLLADGEWKELPTNDIVFDDIKDYKFVECRADRASTFAVITRLKNEKHTVHKRGGKVTSGVDSRVCFVVKQNVFKVSTTVNLQVQPVDSATIADVTSRFEQCSGLIASSPMVLLTTPLKRYTRNIQVIIPLPSPNSKKQQRPRTAAADRGQNPDAKPRPKSAFGSTLNYREEEVLDEKVMMLLQNASGNWALDEEITFTCPKNKDVVTLELDKPLDRFILIRVESDVQPPKAERIVNTLQETLYDRHVQFLLRQLNTDATDVSLVGTVSSKLESAQRRLTEKGYDYGPFPTQDYVMREGQPIKVRFRGNIKDEHSRDELQIVFNSNLKTELNINVAVVDKFAQKAIECYRGFIQLFTPGLVPNRTQEEAAKENKPIEMILGEIMIGELLVNLPKPEPEAPKPIVKRVPVQVKTEGFVDNELLRFIASELGDEWKRVAHYLNVKRSRLQAIARNNVNNDTECTIYDMLLTWIKRVPKSANKVDILIHTLVCSGRADLAEIVRDRERDHKRQMSVQAKGAYLRKGFVRICQAPHVVSDWKFLAHNLELEETALTKIEEENTGYRERCYQMLVTWQKTKRDEATPAALVRALRKCRYMTIADQTEELMKGSL